MVGTRKSCDTLFSIDCDPANVPPAVRKIQPGGSGNRQTSGLARRRANEVTSNNQWYLTSPTGNHSPIHPPPPAINIAECCHSETPKCDNPQDSHSNNNVLVNAFDLREMVNENMCCLHCSKSSQKKTINAFLQFCDECGRGCRDLWLSFLGRKARLGESVFKLEGVNISYEHFGLATTINTCCTKRTRKFKGHKAACRPELSASTNDIRRNNNSNYALNLRFAASCIMNGGGATDAMRTSKMLSLKCFHTFFYQTVAKG